MRTRLINIVLAIGVLVCFLLFPIVRLSPIMQQAFRLIIRGSITGMRMLTMNAYVVLALGAILLMIIAALVGGRGLQVVSGALGVVSILVIRIFASPIMMTTASRFARDSNTIAGLINSTGIGSQFMDSVGVNQAIEVLNQLVDTGSRIDTYIGTGTILCLVLCALYIGCAAMAQPAGSGSGSGPAPTVDPTDVDF